MLPASAPFETCALNRVTFGAREVDVQQVRKVGWEAWVDEQLNPPAGDEAPIAAHLAACSMQIKYAVQLPAGKSPGWPAINERRPLNYLNADLSAIWDMVSKTEISIAPNERTRIQQELNAATWIRNTHARYQVREVMADFWGNHFNVGRQENVYATASLADYDRRIIRPRVFGNFRDLLEAVATSAAMLRYLNNADSSAGLPSENYARELLELHTLGAGVYRGVASEDAQLVPVNGWPVATGFTDHDVVTASRALSGWTLEQGQQGPSGVLPNTGAFFYNPLQHHTGAGLFMGHDLAPLIAPMAQGQRILDILAAHPATAAFICRKLCRRIYGDDPPRAVVEQATVTWLEHRDKPDQIKRVLRGILLNKEIGRPPSKIRRPYERLIALFRTTGTVVNAYDGAHEALNSVGDGIFAWPTPEGRPDGNSDWLSAAANLRFWNLMFSLLDHPSMATSFAAQTPAEVTHAPETIVEYWVGRMVGAPLRPEGMRALIEDVQGPIGVLAAYRSAGITNIENALRRLAVLIATAPEFAVR